MEPSERVPGAFVIAVGSVALCGVMMSSHCVQKAFKMVHVGLIHSSAIVAFLERSISDPKLFDPIFGLLTTLLATDDGPETLASAELTDATISAGIDPLTILAIVEAVAALVKLIRDRRGK